MNHFICVDINSWRLHNKWNPKSIPKTKFILHIRIERECVCVLENWLTKSNCDTKRSTPYSWHVRREGYRSRELVNRNKGSALLFQLINWFRIHLVMLSAIKSPLSTKIPFIQAASIFLSIRFVQFASSFMPTLHNCSRLQSIYTQWITRMNDRKKKETHTNTRISNDIIITGTLFWAFFFTYSKKKQVFDDENSIFCVFAGMTGSLFNCTIIECVVSSSSVVGLTSCVPSMTVLCMWALFFIQFQLNGSFLFHWSTFKQVL